MDLLVVGRIHTLDPRRPVAEAALARDGQFVKVGTRAECEAEARRGARRIDLGRGCAVPGLCDAHAHPYLVGRSLLEVDCRGAASADECARRVAVRAGAVPPGGWIRGGGWDQNRWPGGTFPDAASLSAAVPLHPVVLTRIDGHAAWVNASALAAAGVHAGTPDPPGGRIVRNSRGEPSGILVDEAQDLVLRTLPRPSASEVHEALVHGLAAIARVGLTEVHDAGVTPELLAEYRRLAAAGSLPLRVYAMIDGQVPLAEMQARIAARGPAEAGWLTVRAVKLFADGALGSRGAALGAPYADDASTSGLLLVDPGELRWRLRCIALAGLQPAVHAIGDRACGEVLRALLDLGADVDLRALRPRVEHLQVLAPDDLPLLERCCAIASMQPVHAVSDAPWVERRIGEARLGWAYAWRSVLRAGAPLALGSDAPVDDADPRTGILAAEARTPGGWDAPWTPAERLTRAEALEGFTRGAAYAGFAEHRRGAVREGLDADLTLFGEDLMAVPADELPRVPLLGTVVAGSAAEQVGGAGHE